MSETTAEDLYQITGATLPFKYGDKAFEISALTVGSLGELSLFVKMTAWRTANKIQGVAAETLDKLFHDCLTKAVSVFSEEFNEVLDTIEGQVEFVYHTLKAKQPDITREAVADFDPLLLASLYKAAVNFTFAVHGGEGLAEYGKKNLAALKAKGLIT